MAHLIELQHDGKNWNLIAYDESGVNRVDIPITDQKKNELESLGVGFYEEGV